MAFRKLNYTYFLIIICGLMLIVSVFLPWKERYLPNGQVITENGLGWVLNGIALPRIRDSFAPLEFIVDTRIFSITLLLTSVVALYFQKRLIFGAMFLVSVVVLIFPEYFSEFGDPKMELILSFGILLAFLGAIGGFRNPRFFAPLTLFIGLYTICFMFVTLERNSNDVRPAWDANDNILIKYSKTSEFTDLIFTLLIFPMTLAVALPIIGKILAKFKQEA
jgi:hypothetical protein